MDQKTYNRLAMQYLDQARQPRQEATPSGEIDYLHQAFKAAGVDPESPAGQAIEDLWIERGFEVAIAQLVRYKSAAPATRYKSAAEAQLAQTARYFTDDGRPLARPIRDKNGNPLP